MSIKISKLKRILLRRRMSQIELLSLIKSKYPDAKTNASLINRIATLKHRNYTIQTAFIIAKSLNVPIQDIIDDEENTVNTNS